MDRLSIYRVLQTISVESSETDDSYLRLPESPDWTASLESLGIDMITAQDYFRQLEIRIPSKRFKVPPDLIEKLQLFRDLGELCDFLAEKGFQKTQADEVIYVDDEPENLFIFKRRYGNRLNLKTFEEPLAALDYVLRSPAVALVITDEVMPRMGGNDLCDEIKKSKPHIKFILITGNPNHDTDLMYNSLRRGRFYEFIQKPVDFEKRDEEYFNLIQGLIAFDW